MTRWLMWCGFVILWTIAVEMPYPGQEHIPAGELVLTNKKLIGKTLHLTVYAMMAASAALLPVPPRYRALLMFFLIGHAWLTEWLQELLGDMFHRGGSLSDVGIDLIGIALGVAVTWRWWTAS